MRILMASVPVVGHFHPLVPLAVALRDAGDEVMVASAPSVCYRARSMGFASSIVGTETDQWSETLRARGALDDGLPSDPIIGCFYPRVFGECGARVMADELIALVAEWRPDLVIYESTTLAAPLAAALAGVPAVHHTVSLLRPAEMWALCGDAVAPLWRSYGATPSRFAGLFDGLTLAIWPPSLDTAPGTDTFAVDRLRPVAHDTAGAEVLPPWVERLPDRPTVYMTLGTVFNTDVSIFQVVLEALADAPVNLIVTLGAANDPTAFSVPSNTHVERYLPQSLLLGHCAAVISHGGSGTTLAALAHGLPQLLIPQGADQFVNADRCVESGAGCRLLPDEVNAGAVVSSVEALLTDARYGHAARRLQTEMEGMPSPEEWIGPLRHLVNCWVP